VPVSVFAVKDYFSVPTNNLRIFNRILNRSNEIPLYNKYFAFST
jgi:hypothetical protein